MKNLKVIAGRRSKECEVLLDSGASVSIVRKDVVDELGVHVEKLNRLVTLHGVDGKRCFSTSQVCILQIQMKGKFLDYYFYVVENMPRQMIIGTDFMQRWEVSLFPKREDYRVGVDPNAIELA